MNCADYQGLIAAALYGPLAPDEQARLQSHLVSCVACRQESEELAGAVKLLGKSEPVEVQRDTFASAVRRKLSRKKVRPVATRRPAWVVPASLAAALLLVLVAGVLFKPEKPVVEVAVRPPEPPAPPRPAPTPPEPPAPEPNPPAPSPVVPAP